MVASVVPLCGCDTARARCPRVRVRTDVADMDVVVLVNPAIVVGPDEEDSDMSIVVLYE